MNRSMKTAVCLVLAGAGALFAGGCTSMKGVQTVYPEFKATVDSLQPTLQWKAEADPEMVYDLVIYELPKGGGQRLEIYTRQGIKGTSHKVETALKPDTRFQWTLRGRKGDAVQDWTVHSTTVFLLIYWSNTQEYPFFQTPKQ